MPQIIKKFSAVFFITVFLLGSGGGQLIHAAFHDHNYKIQFNKKESALNTPHNFCCALQLTLPEFFKSTACILKSISVSKNLIFSNAEPAIPHIFSFKNSDRAPPFLV